MIIKYFIAWIGLLLVAILNGAIREKIYRRTARPPNIISDGHYPPRPLYLAPKPNMENPIRGTSNHYRFHLVRTYRGFRVCLRPLHNETPLEKTSQRL